MKEPVKDFNQFSESKITKSSQADVFSHDELKPNPNLPPTSVDDTKSCLDTTLIGYVRERGKG